VVIVLIFSTTPRSLPVFVVGILATTLFSKNMTKPQLLNNEAARLNALHQYKLLDTSPEEAFDDLTCSAAYLCGTLIALISLVDTE